MTDPVKGALANPLAEPLGDSNDTDMFDDFALGRGAPSLEGGTDIVFSATPLPPENLIEGEVRYRTLKEVPVCEIEGGIPITDKYLQEVHQVWVTTEDDRFGWVRFYTPEGFKKLSPKALREISKPKDDAVLRKIQASKENFEFIEQVPTDLVGGREPENIQYNLCRSHKPDKDGRYNLYVYRLNRLLMNTCNAVSEARLKPLPNLKLSDEEATLLVSLGNLSANQYCIASDDWTNKFYITGHLPTVDLLEGRLLGGNTIPLKRRQAIVADIELALSNEREAVARARDALALAKSQAKKSDINLLILIFVAVTQALMVWKILDLKLRRARLEDFGRNLTDMAKRGELGPVIGRFEEVKLVVQRLLRDKKASAILVGEAGAGKTAVVEKLAQLIALGDEAVELLKLEGVSEKEARALTLAIKKVFDGKPIGDVDVSNLVSGTGIRGTFETKLKRFLKVFKKAIPFIDEIHRLMGAGRTRDSSDSADQALKPALGRGDLRMIGATTLEEYMRYIAGDAALRRRFGEPIVVHEYAPEETLGILKQVRDRGYFKKLYGIQPSDAAIEKAVELAPPQETLDRASDIITDALMEGKYDSDYKGGDITAEDVERAFKVREKFSVERYLRDLVEKRGGPKGGGGSGDTEGPRGPVGSGRDGQRGSANVGLLTGADFIEAVPKLNRVARVIIEGGRSVLKPLGGFGPIAGILGAQTTAEHLGWFSPAQNTLVSTATTAAFFMADAGFAAIMLGGMPGAVVGHGATQTLADQVGRKTKIDFLREGELGNKLSGLGGGLAGFGVSLWVANQFKAFRNFHAATAEGTKHLARQVASNIGAVGMRIEGSLKNMVPVGIGATAAVGLTAMKAGAIAVGEAIAASAGATVSAGVAVGAIIYISGAGKVIGTDQLGESIVDDWMKTFNIR